MEVTTEDWVLIWAVHEKLYKLTGNLMQTQYVLHYVRGLAGKPRLADDLRITQDGYHDTFIHPDDVEVLARRIAEYHGFPILPSDPKEDLWKHLIP
jgi:hypothetical protein